MFPAPWQVQPVAHRFLSPHQPKGSCDDALLAALVRVAYTVTAVCLHTVPQSSPCWHAGLGAVEGPGQLLQLGPVHVLRILHQHLVLLLINVVLQRLRGLRGGEGGWRPTGTGTRHSSRSRGRKERQAAAAAGAAGDRAEEQGTRTQCSSKGQNQRMSERTQQRQGETEA